MKNKSILIVLTSHPTLGNTGKETGFHYEEMTTPYLAFAEAGYGITLASIMGGEPPHDPGSLEDKLDDNPESVIAFLKDERAKNALRDTLPVSKLSSDDYCAIYLPGGHGTMWDFPENVDLNRLVSECYQAGKPTAAICHGLAGFIGAKKADGSALVSGKKINCFTDAEEKEIGLQDTVPFLLESALKELGAKFECSANFQAHVATDDNLITGQNPASAGGVAKAVIAYLKDH